MQFTKLTQILGANLFVVFSRHFERFWNELSVDKVYILLVKIYHLIIRDVNRYVNLSWILLTLFRKVANRQLKPCQDSHERLNHWWCQMTLTWLSWCLTPFSLTRPTRWVERVVSLRWHIITCDNDMLSED